MQKNGDLTKLQETVEYTLERYATQDFVEAINAIVRQDLNHHTLQINQISEILETISEVITNDMISNKATIKWKKLSNCARIPTKRVEDAGFDIYANLQQDLVIAPHETVLIPTGLMSMFSKDLVGIVKERGSTGALGLSVRSGVIDSGYRGEWKIAITNLNPYPVELVKEGSTVGHIKGKHFWNKKKVVRLIYPMSKAIAQVLFLPVYNYTLKQITEADLASDKSVRQEGGWGSSGK